jgi:hypothetical protein
MKVILELINLFLGATITLYRHLPYEIKLTQHRLQHLEVLDAYPVKRLVDDGTFYSIENNNLKFWIELTFSYRFLRILI